MARLRNVGKRFDDAGLALWIIDAGDRLIYLNASVAQWLQVDAADLLGQVCHVAVDRETAAGRALAALAVPLDLPLGGSLVRDVSPAGQPSQTVRFSACGEPTSRLVIAISGALPEPLQPLASTIAARLRERLEPWRRQHQIAGLALTAGTSPHVVRLRAQIQLAAASRLPFAISGPQGCGGEPVARLIDQMTHATASLPRHVLVIDTPLMDTDLLEATLAPAANALQPPDGGEVTLVLRDVDEAPAEIQDQLIDFASQQRQGMVGSHSPVRLVGLLNGPMSQATQQGKLTPRMALHLSVLELTLPPLVDRLEDVALIATAALQQRYVQGLASGNSLAQSFSQPALDRMLLYPWPENWDELSAAVRHAASVCRTSTIQANDLPLAIRSFRAPTAAKPAPIVETTLDDAVREYERQKIEQALAAADGNYAEAARILGISRTRLLRKCDAP